MEESSKMNVFGTKKKKKEKEKVGMNGDFRKKQANWKKSRKKQYKHGLSEIRVGRTGRKGY